MADATGPLPSSSRRRVAGALCGLLLATGCAEAARSSLDARVVGLGDARPTSDRFHYCHGYGCDRRVLLALSDESWARITAPLRPPPADAAAERRAVARAAARFERAASAQAGTADDLGGTFAGLGREGQLDCVDEAVNMTQFLRLLDGDGLLRRHRIGSTAHRGNLFDAWPHVAATLVQHDDGRRFAVDSWFFDSGVEPVILPLEVWLEGGEP